MSNEKPYMVSDNSHSITGRGWRVSGPTGFEVFSDHQEKQAEWHAKQMNTAYSAGAAPLQARIEKALVIIDNAHPAASQCQECDLCRVAAALKGTT